MAIIAKDEGTTYPLPPADQYLAVAVDVVDLGMVDVTFNGETKKQHKCYVVFQLAANDENGEPYRVSRRFTLSLNEKANLRGFLESWRGIPFTEQEIRDGFDVERLVGANALLQVVHVAKGDKTYANINSIMKPMKGMAKLAPRLYERVKDRKPEGNGNGAAKPQSAPAVNAGSGIRGGRVADALQPRGTQQPPPPDEDYSDFEMPHDEDMSDVPF